MTTMALPAVAAEKLHVELVPRPSDGLGHGGARLGDGETDERPCLSAAVADHKNRTSTVELRAENTC